VNFKNGITSPHRVRQDFDLAGYFLSHFPANRSRASSAAFSEGARYISFKSDVMKSSCVRSSLGDHRPMKLLNFKTPYQVFIALAA